MFSHCLTCQDADWKEKFEKQCEEMRERSGSVETRSALVTFLYLLMRDELVPGRVEQKVSEAVIAGAGTTGNEGIVFTNGWLAKYAMDMSSRLLGHR